MKVDKGTIEAAANVVDLTGRRGDGADAAFGASISRGTHAGLPANEQALGLIDRIVVDDSLPLYVAALDGTVIHMNGHYRQLDHMLGDATLAPGGAETRGKRGSTMLAPIIGDILASRATVRAEEVAVIGGKERVYLGRHMPVRNEKGEIIAIAGTYEDVTVQVRGIEEASKTQARFQDFARASSDWFFECGADLKITTLSDRFTALVGQPAQLFVGAEFHQFGRFDANLEGHSDGPRAIKMRKPFRDQLFVVETHDGHELKFHLSAVPVFERASGEFRGYRGVGMDVTERYKQANDARQNQERLEKLLAELTRKNIALDDATAQATTALRAKNEFLAAMSHELRTPLNAIIGFAESFERKAFGELEDAYLAYAADIRKSGQHLLGLINDILDVAVIESGGLSLLIDELPLERVLMKAVQMNVEAARKKQIDVDGLLATTSDLVIKADDRRTTQIIVNLLSNAVKFTPEGGSIGCEITENRDDNMVELTIWDTGIGISEENQPKVFEKFHQVTDDVYSRKQEGTGLGLHISRELARRMDGDLTLASNVGEGSRFTVHLPLSDGAAADDNFI
ncbi:sensor histidine kinase [Gimibacter soli]|uniref:histidine kinase n=1 Tax=Gimibacter soli TaxID=3024400 RepID=A0AAF0BKQ9_9PROT|nr:ATP-binding protein [Gimibacter soli]WCL53237.1 ATP-binding protein [Gimibacter soli]